MKSKKVLVTGGAGFIGQHLIKRLVDLNHQVTIIDDLSVTPAIKLPDSVKLIKLSIQSPKIASVLKTINPETIFHLAAANSVLSPASHTLNSNVIGTYNLLNAVQSLKVKQFIFTSSGAVYGETSKLPITEDHPTKPTSAYGVSKLTSELHLNLFKNQFKTSILRFANVYGPGQNASSEGGVVAIFIKKILQNQKPIIYGTGKQTRDFVYVADIVDALISSLNKPQSFTLNLGSNQKTSILDLYKLLTKLLKKDIGFIKSPARPQEVDHSLFDITKAQQMLNWQPSTSLEKGLLKTINHFKQTWKNFSSSCQLLTKAQWS